MPYLNRPDAKVFFDDLGSGEPISTMHGFIENGSYWSRTGVSGALAEAGYRVIDMDMRGHGRSVPEGARPSGAGARWRRSPRSTTRGSAPSLPASSTPITTRGPRG